MHPVIQKTFGGLSPQYYFRQLFFGLLISAFVFYATTRGGQSVSIGTIFFIAVNTLLYPYSRFVYESVIGFIMGSNTFYINALIMLVAKFFTIIMCWVFSIFVAPIGLAYLYYYHSKASSK